MEEQRFSFVHPFHGGLRVVGWSGIAGAVLLGLAGVASGGAIGVLAGALVAGGSGLMLRWSARTYGPIAVTVARHRVRLEQGGADLGGVLLENLDGRRLHDVVLYVQRLGHDGDFAGLADALEVRIDALARSPEVSDGIRKQLAQLRGERS